jgi:hypothetical protein
MVESMDESEEIRQPFRLIKERLEKLQQENQI